MNDYLCSLCQSKKDRNLQLIENFLVHGPPSPPESRATKDDLLREIRQRDILLRQLRELFLIQYAEQFVSQVQEDCTSNTDPHHLLKGVKL